MAILTENNIGFPVLCYPFGALETFSAPQDSAWYLHSHLTEQPPWVHHVADLTDIRMKDMLRQGKSKHALISSHDLCEARRWTWWSLWVCPTQNILWLYECYMDLCFNDPQPLHCQTAGGLLAAAQWIQPTPPTLTDKPTHECFTGVLHHLNGTESGKRCLSVGRVLAVRRWRRNSLKHADVLFNTGPICCSAPFTKLRRPTVSVLMVDTLTVEDNSCLLFIFSYTSYHQAEIKWP